MKRIFQEVHLVHYSRVPFQAVCGADIPNQATTTIRGNVTCIDCLKALPPTPREFTEVIAARRCGRIYNGYRAGFRCLDKRKNAEQNPELYEEKHRKEILEGKGLCDSCLAKLILEASQ